MSKLLVTGSLQAIVMYAVEKNREHELATQEHSELLGIIAMRVTCSSFVRIHTYVKSKSSSTVFVYG